MKLTIYTCTAMIMIGLLANAVYSRYDIEITSIPALTPSETEEVIIRLDKLTGAVCIAIGDDGYNYYDVVWTTRINELRDKKSLFSEVLPPQCD